MFQMRKNGENCATQPSIEGETTQGPQQIDGVTNGVVNGRDTVDTSAGSPTDLLVTNNVGIVQNRNGWNSMDTHAIAIQEQVSYGVVDGFEDAVDEMALRHVAGISRIGNRSAWKTWISGRGADNALITDDEIERDALIGTI